MNANTQIRAWKDAEFRASLDASDLLPNPAGNRLVELDEDEVRGVWGAQRPIIESEGYVCGVSGEVTGESCWSA